MGRTIKYRTEEEKQQARRERRAEKAKDPKHRQKRSEENRRYYLKHRGISGTDVSPPNLSRRIIELAAKELDHSSRYFIRFLTDAEDALDLDCFEVTQDDLKAFNAPPPYPPEIVKQLADTEDWDHVILALRGYQHRLQNVEDIENFQLSTRESLSSSQIAVKLHDHYLKTLAEWDKLTLFLEHCERENTTTVSARIAEEVILGRARTMVHLRSDLLLIKENISGYIQALDNRIFAFSKLARPQYY